MSFSNNNHTVITGIHEIHNRQESIYDLNGVLIATVNKGIGDKPEVRNYAELIVEAVNQCIAINPDNPLAVAQGIKAMHEALVSSIKELDKLCLSSTAQSSYLKGREVIAKVTEV
jgi:hypothetical protein